MSITHFFPPESSAVSHIICITGKSISEEAKGKIFSASPSQAPLIPLQ